MPLVVKHVHNHYYNSDSDEVKKILKQILLTQKTILMNIEELTAKVDALQTSLDAVQAQIAESSEALNQTISDLTAIVSDGGTEEQRQALADKLDSIKTDLEGTVPPTA